MRHVRNPNDLLVGSLLILAALLTLFLTRNLAAGTASDMGPGYLPRLLCMFQILLGGVIGAGSFIAEGEPFESWHWRPLIWVIASLVFFAVSVERFGVVMAIFGLVILACLANRGTRVLVEGIPLAVGMAVFTVLVFIIGLRLTIPILPPFLVP